MPSLVALFAQWLGYSVTEPPRPASPPITADVRAAHGEYPRVERGLPAIGVAEIIAPHQDWLLRLRYAYGADAVTFEREIGSVVERYARYVHLLPATRDSHFRRAGGLFRMGLEIAFYALQGADGAIFSGRQTITERAALEPRWRYAAFLAGLCSGLHRTLTQVTVINDHGDPWPAYLQPLATWLHDTNSQHYLLRWLQHKAANRALGVLAMSHVVAPASMQYLAQDNHVVIAHFMASVSGTVLDSEGNTLDQIVQRSIALVIERDRYADLGQTTEPPDPPDPQLERSRVPSQRTVSQPLSEQTSGGQAAAQAVAATLAVPTRLHPAVRTALRQIIASFDSPGVSPVAMVIDGGIFVPLHEFERRGVDPALAARALSDARMLLCDPHRPQSRTCCRSFEGAPLLGVLLAHPGVRGFEAHAFGTRGRALTAAP